MKEISGIQRKLARLISMVDHNETYYKECIDLFVLLSDFANKQLQLETRHKVCSCPQAIALFASVSTILTNALYEQPDKFLKKLAGARIAYFRYKDFEINNFNGLHVTATGAEKRIRTLYVTIASGLILSYFIPTVVQGNYSVTGCHCGSFAESDIMKAAGYKFSFQSDLACLSRNRFAYLHAPLYHPILALYAQERGDLSFPDVFKLTTALFDPSRSKFSYVGIWEKRFAHYFCDAQLRTLVKKGIVVSSEIIDEFTDYSIIGDVRLGIKSNSFHAYSKLNNPKTLQSSCDAREEWDLILDMIQTRPSEIKDNRGILIWRNVALILASLDKSAKICTDKEPVIQMQLDKLESCHVDIVNHLNQVIKDWRGL